MTRTSSFQRGSHLIPELRHPALSKEAEVPEAIRPHTAWRQGPVDQACAAIPGMKGFHGGPGCEPVVAEAEQACVGSEDPAVAMPMDAGRRNERGQSLEQLEGCKAQLLATVHIGLREPVDLRIAAEVSAPVPLGAWSEGAAPGPAGRAVRTFSFATSVFVYSTRTSQGWLRA